MTFTLYVHGPSDQPAKPLSGTITSESMPPYGRIIHDSEGRRWTLSRDHRRYSQAGLIPMNALLVTPAPKV